MFTNLVFSWDASSSFGPMDSFNVYLLSSEPQPASQRKYLIREHRFSPHESRNATRQEQLQYR